jgi:hypothetical protein
VHEGHNKPSPDGEGGPQEFRRNSVVDEEIPTQNKSPHPSASPPPSPSGEGLCCHHLYKQVKFIGAIEINVKVQKTNLSAFSI